ncbi:hypothetical protein Poli38472_009440 [Pythium oligandrum]|uniref:Protein kinase domain-containing protein n=1 Tax=Pythium oligandrum TaxID=41045 RepID=A0A8K1CGY1_PYTOL|nr:hypothetical protein Poli38472_009440 [Pythium oligandrum]|eukprot:TMW61947.1 hypothetical protein Poli38472_009440 [Pythium oligandrum]
MNAPKLLALLAATAASLDGVRAEESSGSGNVTIYVIVGVVAVLFIGAAIFVWMRNRKRGHDLEAPAIQQMAPPQNPSRANPPRSNGSQAPGSSQYRQYDSPAMGRPGQQQGYSQNPGDHRAGPQGAAPGRGPAPRAPRDGPAGGPAPGRPQNRPASNPPNNAPRQNAAAAARGPRPGSKSSEVAARVLAEFQSDPALCRRKIPYAALYFTRVLSKGAFGEVWLAQLENRQVAVKRILNEKKNDEKEIECFAAEIKLMASFFHPKIVEFVGVSWSTLQDLCAVTEYMAKGDLYGFLKRKNGQLNWRDHKIYLAEDVADALGYLHSLTPKVIHRDLKSKNILLDDTFRAKLSDFGISRERSLEETMTAGVGTIYWTAPEVLMGKKYTEKADIYSFGIVMSELDTHEVPYSDMRDEAGKKLQGMKIVQQVIKKKVRPSFTPDCPPKVRDLAMRCLDAEPDVRPDATELLLLIQRIQQKL